MGFTNSNYWHGKLSNEILKRDKKCLLCDSSEDLLIDHIVPVKSGGKNTLENQRLLCRGCHSKITNTKELKSLTTIGKYLREWRKHHPGYLTDYHRVWRKKHPGYFNKYKEGSWQLYKNA